jgi:hypothetical protein
MTREQIAWFRAGSALNAGTPIDPQTGETAADDLGRAGARRHQAKPGKDV